MKKKKILFSCLHRPDRSPSQRFRFEQYLSELSSQGYEYRYSYLISANDDKYFYAKGHYLRKAYILLKSTFKRLFELLTLPKYDIIFVQREAFMLGTSFFERRYAKSKAKYIFDFDDSIWLQNVSTNNKALSFLKNASKTQELIELADLVITGNDYLKNYALQFNKNVIVIPTTVDTDKFSPVPNNDKTTDPVCIGWSGSHTTIEHFKLAEPVLEKLKKKWQDKVTFKVIGDPHYTNEALGIQGIKWSSDTEVSEMHAFDIGIMPLPDSEWTKGKCGLKGLTYMSLEICTVMEAVGVNPEIIKSGENGFLCKSEDEWYNTLDRLIDDHILRNSVTKNARTTVINRFSIHSQKQKFISAMN